MWLDFGYNLGNNTYIDSAQFNFSLIPQECIINDKINFFCLGENDERSLPHILLHGTQMYITGGCMYGSRKSWLNFNKQMQQALQAFISFNIMDDDQKLYIWCLRNYPECFNILEIDDWFNAILYFMPDSIRRQIKMKKTSILQYSLNPTEHDYLLFNQQNNIQNKQNDIILDNKNNMHPTLKHKTNNRFFKKIIKLLKY